MSEIAKRNDPLHGYNFEVQIDGIAVAGFRECGGLSFNADPVDYREGTDRALHVRKLTGLRKFANITLKHGITDNKELWKLYKKVLNGESDRRRNGAIILRNEEHRPVLRWNFENAWICKYEAPTLNATNNEVAVESIEICPERVELDELV